MIAGIGAGPWIEAASKVSADLGVELVVRRVGYRREYDDVWGDWSRLRGVGDRGALLVRPDGHIAYRAAELPADPEQALASALRHVLAVDGRAQAAPTESGAAVSAAGL